MQDNNRVKFTSGVTRKRKPEEILREYSAENNENQEPNTKRKRDLEISRGFAVLGSTTFIAPVSWSADLNASGTALQLYQEKCYVATKDARVISFDLDGQAETIQQLPHAVENFMIDDGFLYAWCPQRNVLGTLRGAIFDLSGEEPRRVAEVANFGTLAVHCDLVDGLVVLADNEGSLKVQTLAGEHRWLKQQELAYTGLLMVDRTGIYVGHRKRVTKYALQDGEELWNYDVIGRQYKIETCQQTENDIFFVVNGKLHQLSKGDGSLVRVVVPRRHKASGIGIGQNMLITGSCPSVIFDLETGEERYRMNFAGRLGDGCMQLHPSGRTFTAWDKLYCLDLSPEGVMQALDGRSRASKDYTVRAGYDVAEMETVSATKAGPDGAVVHVKTDEDGLLVANPTGSQYHVTWPVLLPVTLMDEGQKFIIERLIPCEQHKFYRIQGHIYELRHNLNNGTDWNKSSLHDDILNVAESLEQEDEAETCDPSGDEKNESQNSQDEAGSCDPSGDKQNQQISESERDNCEPSGSMEDQNQ